MRNCCTFNCRQGRDCPHSAAASALSLGLHRLVQVDGGHRVHGSDTVRLPAPREESPKPQSFAARIRRFFSMKERA